MGKGEKDMDIPDRFNHHDVVKQFIREYCSPYRGYLMFTVLSDESYGLGFPVDTVLGVRFTTTEESSETYLVQWSESQNKLVPYSEA